MTKGGLFDLHERQVMSSADDSRMHVRHVDSVPRASAISGRTEAPAARPKAVSRVERVRDLFLARPNQWIDGRELASVGGAYAWRTRVSDCRRKYGMQIRNRERWVTVEDRQGVTYPSYVASEYQFIPAGTPPEAP